MHLMQWRHVANCIVGVVGDHVLGHVWRPPWTVAIGLLCQLVPFELRRIVP
jgi:hypothetical protein